MGQMEHGHHKVPLCTPYIVEFSKHHQFCPHAESTLANGSADSLELPRVILGLPGLAASPLQAVTQTGPADKQACPAGAWDEWSETPFRKETFW